MKGWAILSLLQEHPAVLVVARLVLEKELELSVEYFLSTCCGLLLRQPLVEVHPEEVEDLVLVVFRRQEVACLQLEVQDLEVAEGEVDLDQCIYVRHMVA